ncbi:MAG: glycerol-3-phosphate 1-O-acyltransferase PlsY [Vampirovibrionales bacterium]|nr:glycerol-3-phosphate 1-O-acyltransferase PlsY [Vampirovibrionales bacterium]
MPTWMFFIYALLCYLLGAIPTAYIVVKRLTGLDIRAHGSGNVGATNVKRVAGAGPARFVLIVDGLKGFLPVLASQVLFPQHTVWHVIFAALCLIGHSKSVFINFKGGKGAITGLGTMFALVPAASLIAAVVALIVFKLTRIVSVATISACLVVPITCWLLNVPDAYLIYACAAAVLVIVLHRSNISRLLKGQEGRLT